MMAPKYAAMRGHALELIPDAGGDRWWLDGRPIHAGDDLFLLVETRDAWCPGCGDDDARKRCVTCGGAGRLVDVGAVRVRFEFRNARSGLPSRVTLVLPAIVTGGERPRVELEAEQARCVRLSWSGS